MGSDTFWYSVGLSLALRALKPDAPKAEKITFRALAPYTRLAGLYIFFLNQERFYTYICLKNSVYVYF